VKENKSVAEIVQAAKVAVAATDKYGTATHKETAKRLMVQAYNIMGTNYFTEKEYENALLAFDSLLIVDPDYSNAIYNKALVYRSQNNSEAFEEAIDLYLSKLLPELMMKGQNRHQPWHLSISVPQDRRPIRLKISMKLSFFLIKQQNTATTRIFSISLPMSITSKVNSTAVWNMHRKGWKWKPTMLKPKLSFIFNWDWPRLAKDKQLKLVLRLKIPYTDLLLNLRRLKEQTLSANNLQGLLQGLYALN
jgi:hypothetical protein